MAVAELFRVGIANLHPLAREGIAVGLLTGTALAIVEWLFPKDKKWIPSATGIGLGVILPFFHVAVVRLRRRPHAWAFGIANRRQADRFVVPISSGVIAGESIVGSPRSPALNNFVLK